MEVMPVDDQLADHLGGGEAGADDPGVTMVQRAHGVAEVGRHRGAGGDRRARLLERGVGVADGGDDARGRQLADGVDGAGPLGGDRHHPQAAVGGGNEARRSTAGRGRS